MKLPRFTYLQYENCITGAVEVFAIDNSDSDDDAPLVKRQRKTKPGKENPAKWKKMAPIYAAIPPRTAGARQRMHNMQQQCEHKTPVEMIELMLDQNLLDHVVQQTVLYAQQKNVHNFIFNSDDLKNFIGILLFTGYHKLPRERMYWSLDKDVHVDIVAECMSIHKFREIKRCIHFNDNSQIGSSTDKMFKIKPLCDILRNNFCQWGIMHENLAVDEMMVRYFGHHSCKMFIKGKPIRFGFKMWLLCSSTGYCYNMDVYCGRNTVPSNDKTPLGTKVVTQMLEVAENPMDHQIYFDNFFTSYDLLVHLRDAGFFATGTIRENRTQKCPLTPSTQFRKELRGTSDYRFDTNKEIYIAKWNDNSVVGCATNFDTLEPQVPVKRWCKQVKAQKTVQQPLLIANYNKCMGGVDLHDQTVNKYRIAVRAKKWWWPIFTAMLSSATVNAWRLHQLSHDASQQIDLLQFIREIAISYINLGKNQRNQQLVEQSGRFREMLHRMFGNLLVDITHRS